jgi:hypothetical protein
LRIKGGLAKSRRVRSEDDVVEQERATRKVESDLHRGFVERNHPRGVAGNPCFIAQGLSEHLAEHNAYILNGVMEVNLKVPGGTHFKIKPTVASQLLKHVIKERNPR